MSRRTVPVERERHVLEAAELAHLFLADIVRPATAVAALGAGDRGEHQDRSVDLVAVEPVVDAGAEQDHAAPTGVDRVLRPLPGEAFDLSGGHPGVFLLPGRRRRHGRVVVAGRPHPRQTLTGHSVLRQHQVEDGGDQPVADAPHRHATPLLQHPAVLRVEARQQHFGHVVAGVVHAEHGVEVAQFEVPLPDALVAVPIADRSIGRRQFACGRVEHHRLPHGVLGVGARRAGQIPGDEVLARTEDAVVTRLEADEVRQVGVLLVVGGEERLLGVDEELLQDDVGHAHRERAVGAGRRVDPLVRELHVLGVVGCDGQHLLSAITRLGHPVRVRGAGERNVRAPHDQVAGVPPVARLGHVGLVPEHLRRGIGQVGVPVVEREHRCPDEFQEPGTGRVRHRRHRRDRREPGDAVRTELLDRVHVGRGDDLDDVVPARTDESALAPGLLVPLRLGGVLDDRGPGGDRVAAVLDLRGPEHLCEHPSHIRVAHPGRAVGVPAERGAARAAARLVVGLVGARAGVVGLLRLPGDDPVLDVDLPRAGSGAVDAVGRTHHLVVTPPVAVERVSRPTTDLVHRAQVCRHLLRREVAAGAQQRRAQRVVHRHRSQSSHSAQLSQQARP